MKPGASEMDGSADETNRSATTKTLDYLKPMYEPSPRKRCDKECRGIFPSQARIILKDPMKSHVHR